MILNKSNLSTEWFNVEKKSQNYSEFKLNDLLKFTK